MDFDSIISLILLFLFFVFPSIVKKWAKEKKPRPAKQAKAVKPSIFQKIAGQIRDQLKELERQAQMAKHQEQGTVWDELDDREIRSIDEGLDESPAEESFAFDGALDFEQTDAGGVEPFKEPQVPRHFDPARPFVQPEKKLPGLEMEKTSSLGKVSAPAFAVAAEKVSAHELRQAVIWSEILAKPVALRD